MTPAAPAPTSRAAAVRRRARRHVLVLALAALAVLGAGAAARAASGAPTAPATPAAAPLPLPAASGSASAPASAAPGTAPAPATTCPPGYVGLPGVNGQLQCQAQPTASSSAPAPSGGQIFGGFDVTDPADCATAATGWSTAAATTRCAGILDGYQLTYDSGSWSDVGSQILGLLTTWAWTLAKITIGFAIFILVWSLKFGLASVLLAPVQKIATAYQQVLDALGLPVFFLTVTAFLCGIEVLYRSKSRGVSEFALSAVVAALAAGVLSAPATLLLGDRGLLGDARALSLSVTATVMGQTPSGDPAQVTDPLVSALLETFVREPDELLQYGTVLKSPGAPTDPCYGVYAQQLHNEITAGSPGGSSPPNPLGTLPQAQTGATWTQMAACNSGYAAFNQHPSAPRLFGAVAMLIANVIILALVLIISGGFLLAQVNLGFEAVRVVFATCFGVLIGGGRAVLWRTVAGVIKAVSAVLLSIMFVGLFCVMLLVLISATAGTDLMLKFTLVDASAIAGLVFHRRLINAGKDMSFNFQRRMERLRVGGSQNSLFVRPARLYDQRREGGLRALRAEASGELGRITGPALAAGAMARRLWVGPPRANARAAAHRTTGPGGGGGGGAGGAAPGRLAAALQRTRGGRASLRTGRLAAGATRVAWGGTVGLPVSAPRAARAAQQRAEQVRDRLAAARGTRVDAARAYAEEYRQGLGLIARATGLAAVGREARDAARFVFQRPPAPPPPPPPPP